MAVLWRAIGVCRLCGVVSNALGTKEGVESRNRGLTRQLLGEARTKCAMRPVTEEGGSARGWWMREGSMEQMGGCPESALPDEGRFRVSFDSMAASGAKGRTEGLNANLRAEEVGVNVNEAEGEAGSGMADWFLGKWKRTIGKERQMWTRYETRELKRWR